MTPAWVVSLVKVLSVPLQVPSRRVSGQRLDDSCFVAVVPMTFQSHKIISICSVRFAVLLQLTLVNYTGCTRPMEKPRKLTQFGDSSPVFKIIIVETPLVLLPFPSSGLAALLAEVWNSKTNCNLALISDIRNTLCNFIVLFLWGRIKSLF